MSETVSDLELEDDVDLEEEVEAEVEDAPARPKPEQRERRSACPQSPDGHKAIANPKKRGPYDYDYVCQHCGYHKWTHKELEELIADVLLRKDSNRELCRVCHDEDPDSLPYGEETGQIEWQPQFDKGGEPVLDEAGDLLYVAYPELVCEKGHRWYLGEGPRRDIRGPNPILFESHLYTRKRRELMAQEGVVDPAYTMDRWGKRPTHGLYGRSHPQGRPINTPEQRKAHGAGFYK